MHIPVIGSPRCTISPRGIHETITVPPPARIPSSNPPPLSALPLSYASLNPHTPTPPQVREAMASLLCALSSSRAIHFYDVVPLDMLLDAMAHDQPSVSHKIQSILVPSYFPSPEEGSVSLIEGGRSPATSPERGWETGLIS